jgi:non-ribosomal peptide synthetase component E (peptide arylation enzyme)
MAQETQEMTEAEAKKAIEDKIQAAYALINEAEEIADKYKLSFGFSVAYGMGGYYDGDPENRSEYSEDGWYASSQSC